MMVHVPMAVLGEKIKRCSSSAAATAAVSASCVAISNIEHIDLVEIDERVVAVCKEYLPGVACSLDDPRVHSLSGRPEIHPPD